ncbi:peptidoglycan DD-metalloendopeptidase family protein [Ancylobacter mangrovi]|uniref:peptidoglycan DD-metalloendopeptidase family protein n=1 Tax=Ancylobacter mangrovi TaxID=2972472 RepID=UPI002162F073|nr:peptidoglycan DD-metalloendopeptidase family protein [Ancylobacter mangrovi]MCS0505301.1 peptidoglycan DD-metalloendopeptidase family protein [Ancylobacter mangrovi]
MALLGGVAAACSSDVGRFGAQTGAPAYTGSVAAAPTGSVQGAPMAPPGGAVASSYPSPYGQPVPQPYGTPRQMASANPQQPVYGTQPAYGAQPGYGAQPQQTYGAQPAYGSQPAYGQPQPLYGTRPQPAPVAATPEPPASPAPVVTAAATGGGSHVVTSGETLSSISRTYGIARGSLAAANGLDMNAQVRIGQKLTIPAAGAPVVASASRVPEPPAVPAAPAAKPLAAPTPSVAAAPNAAPAPAKPQTIAAVKPSETPDEVRTDNNVQFRWPVRGRVISGFGPKPGGQQNEGINVSVPEGTSIKAAEDGVVAYAGSELKGYGNLVLIKHSDGYVTAYAHNSEIDVKKGDTVRRGQVIAKAGQTGNVSTPQLHFEIRKGSQPVDPSQYLAGL